MKGEVGWRRLRDLPKETKTGPRKTCYTVALPQWIEGLHEGFVRRGKEGKEGKGVERE